MLRRCCALLYEDGPRVTGLRVKKGRKYLMVKFEGVEEPAPLSAEYLRVYTSSAERTGHAPEQRKLVQGKKNVTIENLYQVGNYAVTIEFSDGHKSGIYGWQYLHELATHKYKYMRSYIEEVREAKASRTPPKYNDTPSIASKVMDKLRARRKDASSA